jgi:hypothetical protein
VSVWAARSAANAAGLVATIALVAIGPTAARAQALADSLDGLPIRHLEIVARNIYDPLPGGPLKPLYRLADAIHIRTRPSTIRNALVLHPGEPWSAQRGKENERVLRALGILEPVRIEATRAGNPDDSVDVLVETRDDWTTQPEFAIQSAQGDLFLTVALTERNLMGWGKNISFSYREAPEGITRGAEYLDPNLLGSRVRVAAHAATGSEGAGQGVDLGVPFYAESAPYSYGFRWNRATSVARLYQSGDEAAKFDRRVEETNLYWGQGFRLPREVVRIIGTFILRDRRFGESEVQPGAPEEFAGGEENIHERRWGGEAQWWRPAFVEREGIERLGGVEDVDLGPSVRVTAGYSPQWLGATADEGYVGTRFDGGFTAGPHAYGTGALDFRTRLRREPLETLTRGQVRWVMQPLRTHTLLLAGYGAAAYRPERDYQEILGGLSGMRGQPVRGLTGHQAWRFNAEHRWWVGRDFFQLISLGTASFYDLGRTWGPGASPGGWRQDAGIGLRLALPRSGQDRVARIDIAWPIARFPGDDRGPVLSFGSGQAF